MENSLGKKVKKILKGAVVAAAITGLPDDVKAQGPEEGELDYKKRMEMYKDSLTLYTQGQKEKEILDKAETYYEWEADARWQDNKGAAFDEAMERLKKTNGEYPQPRAEHKFDGEAGARVFEKPIKPKIPQKKEEESASNITIPEQVPGIIQQEELSLETYIMPDGHHYTYEQLIKFFPTMKDSKVFERNFGKKPPVEK